MKTISRIASTKDNGEVISSGLNQLHDGRTEPAGTAPRYTRTSATPAKISYIPTSTVSNTRCTQAETSRPRAHNHVITAMNATPTNSTPPLVALWPMPSAPTSKKLYYPAIWARLAITKTSAATMAHPPNQARRARMPLPPR